jgi:hypothetical protein
MTELCTGGRFVAWVPQDKEWDLFPTPEALRRAKQRVFPTKARVTLGDVVYFTVLLVPANVAGKYVADHSGLTGGWHRAVWYGLSSVFALGGAAVFFVYLAAARRRRFLRKLLREEGVIICLHCGYDLRGLTEGRCPECGHSFDPALLEHDHLAGDAPATEGGGPAGPSKPGDLRVQEPVEDGHEGESDMVEDMR